MRFAVAADTGGTFIDVVVRDEDGNHHIGKALTTHDQVFRGMREALERIGQDLGVSARALLANTDSFIYGTTRATNAIVTRTAAKTAFLTTEGFPEILVLKEGGKRDVFDYATEYPDPYIPRRRTFEVPERVSSEAAVTRPLDEAVVRRILGQLRAERYEAVAVCLLWSIVHPAHELRIGELIEEILPGIPYTLSHQIAPIVREYRRASATAIDASLKPLMQSHFRGLEADLRAFGYAGQLLISSSAGGVMTTQEMIAAPINAAKSGPAMAPVAAVTYSNAENLGGDTIVCDTGGTTFDVGLSHASELVYTRETWLGGEWEGDLLGISSVDIRSVGSGGGSIAWVDHGGLLRVGPQSAGSEPGPACYGRGGTEATLSDAACVLGFFDPDYFLGGRMDLDTDAARRAVERVAVQLGRGVDETAWGILTLAGDHMVKAVHDMTISQGLDPAGSTVVAGGGAAGLNIMQIAAELGCRQVILPKTAAALSASGMHFADIVKEESAPVITRSCGFDRERVNRALADLEDRLAAFAARIGLAGNDYRIECFTEARYEAQVWDIVLPIPVTGFQDDDDLDQLRKSFDAEHERLFAFRDDTAELEFISWKARLTADLHAGHPPVPAVSPHRGVASKSRRCYFGQGERVDTPVYLPADLRPGQHIDGPAIIQEPTTTLVVYPGMATQVSSSGNYILDVAATGADTPEPAGFDPILSAILANRLDGIVREMTTTLLRSARSAVINSGRDFSCAIATADSELLVCAEGLPVHVFGTQLQAADVIAAHPDLAEGDAFLDNNPYGGNSHAADHSVLVPVFVDGEHLFTAVAKAHQADCGNSVPTTYFAAANDVYQEGAMIFPAVRVQRQYKTVDDVMRMCLARIRVPRQWQGDFLAALGAARVAERRLKDLCAKYGREVIKQFIRGWFDYSGQIMRHAIEALPAAKLHNTGRHDPFLPYLPDGLPFNVDIDIRPAEGRITVDLTDNLPNVECGLNLTEATTLSAVYSGVLNGLHVQVPKNSGAFRRVDVRLKRGAAVGIPEFPHSCSVATTNVAERLTNCVGSAFAQLGEVYGVAEGPVGLGVPHAVVSGFDSRIGDRFINQLLMGAAGGPGSPGSDGWLTWNLPSSAGLTYRDSVEIDEIKMPIHYRHVRMLADTGGAGEHRGGATVDLSYESKEDSVSVIYPCDGQVHPPKGVRGGRDGALAACWFVDADGKQTRLPNNATVTLRRGEAVRGVECSGGGYGDPLDRDPKRVLSDVLDRWETAAHAQDAYGVVITGRGEDLAVDDAATAALRAELRKPRPGQERTEK